MTGAATRALADSTAPQRRILGLAPAQLAAFGVILVAAAAFRLWHVTQPLTDAYSWRETANALIADGFQRNGWDIARPEVTWIWAEPRVLSRDLPLSPFLAAILNALFGWHDWTGRAVSVLFGLISVVAVHRLTALLWSERHANGAALAYALMPAAIVADTTFAPEAAMLALVTTGTWLLLRYAVRGGVAALVAGAVCLGIGMMTRPLFLAAVPAAVILAAAFAGRFPSARVRWLLAGLVAALALVASWAAFVILSGAVAPPHGLSGLGFLWDGELDRLLADRFYLPELWRAASSRLLGWPYLFLIVVGLWSMPTAAILRKDVAGVALPAVWFLAGIALYVLAARGFAEHPWHLHIVTVPLAMFAGRGLVVIFGDSPVRSGRGIARRSLTFGAILAFAAVPLVARVKAPFAGDGRDLGLELARLAAPGEPVAALGPEAGDPVALYYSRAPGWLYPPGGGKADWSRFPADGSDAIAAIDDLKARGAVWFGAVRSARDAQGQTFADAQSQLLAYLNATAARVVDTDRIVIYRLAGD